MKKEHVHRWRQAFTETKNGSVVRSFLRCENPDCDEGDGWKAVEGSFNPVEKKEYNVILPNR